MVHGVMGQWASRPVAAGGRGQQQTLAARVGGGGLGGGRTAGRAGTAGTAGTQK